SVPEGSSFARAPSVTTMTLEVASAPSHQMELPAGALQLQTAAPLASNVSTCWVSPAPTEIWPLGATTRLVTNEATQRFVQSVRPCRSKSARKPSGWQDVVESVQLVSPSGSAEGSTLGSKGPQICPVTARLPDASYAEAIAAPGPRFLLHAGFVRMPDALPSTPASRPELSATEPPQPLSRRHPKATR